MRQFNLALPLSAVLFGAGIAFTSIRPVAADEPIDVGKLDDVKLVQLLGEDAFDTRQRAHDELQSRGAKARKALDAGMYTDDPEVLYRLEKLRAPLVKPEYDAAKKVKLPAAESTVQRVSYWPCGKHPDIYFTVKLAKDSPVSMISSNARLIAGKGSNDEVAIPYPSYPEVWRCQESCTSEPLVLELRAFADKPETVDLSIEMDVTIGVDPFEVKVPVGAAAKTKEVGGFTFKTRTSSAAAKTTITLESSSHRGPIQCAPHCTVLDADGKTLAAKVSHSGSWDMQTTLVLADNVAEPAALSITIFRGAERSTMQTKLEKVKLPAE